MKRFKRLLVFILIFISTILVNNTKSFAAEVQYTENVIPTMTNDTAPSGKASASSFYNSTTKAYYAFNHEITYAWTAQNLVPYGWLEYDFSEGRCITKYAIYPTSYAPNINVQSPKNWIFEAWDEQLDKWIVLDTRSNVANWSLGVKKEFTFNNIKIYNKYRLNVSANMDTKHTLVINELEMMETVKAPINLTASVQDINANLSWEWDSATNAQYYNIKRSAIPGGPYETVASGSAISFTDQKLDPGTYYYVVSAAVSGTESADSNEVSVTIDKPIPLPTLLKVVLEVNEQLQLSIDDDLDENIEMNWTSSDNAVATVDGNGVVTALKPGNTVVTVVSKDGTYTDKINILVVENADDYRLAVDLKVGKSCRLTVDDLTNTVPVTWDSLDPTVATVASNGKVTAVSKGLTLITATDKERNIIGQVYVRVRQ